MHHFPLSMDEVQHLLADTRVATWVWDVQHDRVLACSNMARLFGVTDAEAMDGAPIERYLRAIHPEDRPRVETKITQMLRGQMGFFEVEYRVSRADGSICWVSTRGKVDRDAEGKPLRFPGVAFDVTERCQAEANLIAAKEEAEAASRAKDNFLAALSHELRNPLTPVLMTASSLSRDESLPTTVREQLAMVQRNIALEARLIDDLLDLTHISRGKLSLRPERCDVHSLVGRAVSIVREDAHKKSIDIVLELTATRSHVTGDSARLQQVFWNLLRNAVKFTPAGGHIRVHSCNQVATDAPAWLRLVVEDNGVGFAPEAAQRIFKPFEQATPGLEKQFGGLGLGLAIARAIVKLHQGEIQGASQGSGLGATFTVELPGAMLPALVRVAKQPDDAFPPPHEEQTLRLLVVEDDEATRQVLERLLKRVGHRVFTASTVAEARAAAAEETFDAVVSDLGLPDGTGNELMEGLREQHGLRGIALSGYGMEEDRRRSQASGFSVHLVKPIDMDELRRALRQFERTGG